MEILDRIASLIILGFIVILLIWPVIISVLRND
jgi:hypothetical protein